MSEGGGGQEEEEEEILHALETPGQLETPVRKFNRSKICNKPFASKKSART